MISNNEISKWKIIKGWNNYTPRVIGNGFMSHPYITGKIEGSLVEITNEKGNSKFLFISDKPVIDPEPFGNNRYLFHEGIFEDGDAYGRCWFMSSAEHKGNLIRTNNNGVFTKCEHIRGLIV